MFPFSMVFLCLFPCCLIVSVSIFFSLSYLAQSALDFLISQEGRNFQKLNFDYYDDDSLSSGTLNPSIPIPDMA